VLVVLLTIYGRQVGNFVIYIEDVNRKSLSLSEDISFSKTYSRLTAKGVYSMAEATLADIPYDSIVEKDGSNNPEDKKYLAYSFYLKNMSSTHIEYSAEFAISSVSKGVDSAIRIMVINESGAVIYAKPSESDGDIDWNNPVAEDHTGDYDYSGQPIREKYTTTPFKSAVTVYSDIFNIEKDQIHKYTVIFWIEGMDEQCTEDIKAGTLKTELKFSVL